MTSEAQKAATKRYKAAGKQKTMTLHFASAEYELIEDFAKKKLCPVATYCRDAIRQRLDADGAPPLEIKRGRPFAQQDSPAPEQQDAKQLRMITPAETPEEAPPPKRRGRPAGSKDKHPRGSRTTGGEQTNIEPEQE